MTDDQIDKLAKIIAGKIYDNIEKNVLTEPIDSNGVVKLTLTTKQNEDYNRGVLETLEALGEVLNSDKN